MKQVLLALFVLFLVIIIGGATVGFPTAQNNGSAINLFTTSAAVKKADITLGNEKDLSLLSKNIKWDPDGHISYVTFPGGTKRYFITGNQRTYTIDTPSSITLQKAVETNQEVKENFGPDKSVSYRNFYATINSVVQTNPKDLNNLFAFAQYEEQAVKPDGTNDYANFTASIGLLESKDGGNTWKDYGPVIRGDDFLAPGTKISGAGEPSAVINNGYLYVYYVDWAAGVKINHPDQIYVARTKIFPDGGLGAFEFYKQDNQFSQGEYNLKPVITIPDGSNGGYTSTPSISFNKYLGQYLAIYQTDTGFYQSFSTDGITWTDAKVFYQFDKPLSQRTSGDVWVSYPTLLSDSSEKSDGSTAVSGNLYFAKGTWPNTAHQLTVKPFSFK